MPQRKGKKKMSCESVRNKRKEAIKMSKVLHIFKHELEISSGEKLS